MRKILLGGAVALLAGCSLALQRCTVSEEHSDNPVFTRIVFVGASASSGTGTDTTLADEFERTLRSAHGPIANFASGKMFLDARTQGKKQVEDALACNPTLAVAADYLFWFVYGPHAPEMRLTRLHEGLGRLQHFTCPVVVGTIPDMRPAAGGVLPTFFVPSTEELTHYNTVVREWARERQNVVLLPVAALVQAQLEGRAYQIDGVGYATEGRLQKDKLHPNVAGLRLLTLLLRHHLVTRQLAQEVDFR